MNTYDEMQQRIEDTTIEMQRKSIGDIFTFAPSLDDPSYQQELKIEEVREAAKALAIAIFEANPSFLSQPVVMQLQSIVAHVSQQIVNEPQLKADIEKIVEMRCEMMQS